MNPMSVTLRFVTLGLLCTFTGMASIIPVANFSFEALPGGGLPGLCGPNCFYDAGPISGWVGGSGQFQPGTQASNFTYYNTLTDGITVAYSTGATISQTVGDVVQEGNLYTLMVDLGRRNSTGFFAGADLLINGNRIAASGFVPTPGNWSTFTATYIGLLADVGQQITIELTTIGSPADFDNVRLSALPASATPEPAGVTLLGLGLAGLLVFARRKRAS